MVGFLKIKVSDIKQYMYCPRIIYFTYCQPVYKKTTYKMEVGKKEHERIEKLENRRTLQRYGIIDGKRIFKVPLFSEKLGLSGILDMMIFSDKEIIPVEYKFSFNNPTKNQKYQVTAYALLLEEKYNQKINKGIIYLIPEEKPVIFDITQSLKDDVLKVLKEINLIIQKEKFPLITPIESRCNECEYYNYCGDI